MKGDPIFLIALIIGFGPPMPTNVSLGQPSIIWERTYATSANETFAVFDCTSDGDFVIASSQYLDADPLAGNIFIRKTDSCGNTLWSVTIDHSERL